MQSLDHFLIDPMMAIQVARKYTGVLQNATFAMIEHTEDLRITAWNRGAEELFGYARTEAVDRSLTQLRLLQGNDSELWRRWACEDSKDACIWSHVRQDGRTILCEWVHHPMRDEQGKPVSAVCFGRDVTTQLHRATLCEQKELILHALVRSLPLSLWVIDPEGIFVEYERNDPPASGPPPQILGMNVLERYPDMAQWVQQALAGKRAHWLTHEANGAYGENWAIPIQNERGEITAVVGIMLDVSKGKHLEHYLRRQLDLIKKQRQVIRELSTPILEVWDNVLMLPLIGLVEGTWTSEMMGTLLEAIAQRRARFAILDLTGVEAVDDNTATYLTDLVDAMRFIGTEGIVTGIRSKVAQTMIALGHDLSGVRMLSNLKAGIMYCITQMDRSHRSRSL